MRRFILIFMMLLLPLQWSWAAAASVCEHEAGKAHFGHHEHQHDKADGPQAQPDDTTPAAKKLGEHPDCQTCHGVGAFCIANSPDGALGWRDGALPQSYGHAFPEPPVEGLLRPPMTPLVA
jgi:hypothetical protein